MEKYILLCWVRDSGRTLNAQVEEVLRSLSGQGFIGVSKGRLLSAGVGPLEGGWRGMWDSDANPDCIQRMYGMCALTPGLGYAGPELDLMRW